MLCVAHASKCPQTPLLVVFHFDQFWQLLYGVEHAFPPRLRLIELLGAQDSGLNASKFKDTLSDNVRGADERFIQGQPASLS